MNRPLCLILAALALAIFPSCESANPYDRTVFRLEEGPRSAGGANRYGYRGDGSDEIGDRRVRRSIRRDENVPATTDRGETRTLRTDENSDLSGLNGIDNDFSASEPGGASSDPVADNKPETGGSTEPSTPAATDGDKPFADPVAGKYGHVISPFAPGREVDVTGFPPGTEVRCPYTQKIFRVP